MTALTAERYISKRPGSLYNDPLAAAVKIYQGSLVVLDNAGNARPGRASTTDRVRGVAQATVDNTAGAAGALSVDTETGVFRFANSAAGDLIVRTDIGADCYVVDDQTVAKTSATNTRIVAGKVRDVDADGVWVQIGNSGST